MRMRYAWTLIVKGSCYRSLLTSLTTLLFIAVGSEAQVQWCVISSGGTKMLSENFSMLATVDHSIIGVVSGHQYSIEQGFWCSTCCRGKVGDANNSGLDEPTIGDVSTMIDALFISENCSLFSCFAEADINQSGGWVPSCIHITIGDISLLIDYLFIAGPQNLSLPNCIP